MGVASSRSCGCLASAVLIDDARCQRLCSAALASFSTMLWVGAADRSWFTLSLPSIHHHTGCLVAYLAKFYVVMLVFICMLAR
eukprot:5054984-Amphidinium_carterae.1